MGSGLLADRVRAFAEQVAIDHGVELVHIEIAGPTNSPVVQVFIDKEGGVTHEDCAGVSLHLGTILDVEDIVPSAYTLELSSPGIERGLYRIVEYERFAGRPAKLKSRIAINGQRNFRGRIKGVEGSSIVLDDRTTGIVVIPFDSIVKANLEFDENEEFHRDKRQDQSAAKAKARGRNHN